MSNDDNEPFVQRLRQLIGRDCRFYGRHCRIVEVLHSERRVVLEARDRDPPILRDQYGQAARRGYEHIEVPMFDSDDGFSDDLLHLLDSLQAPDAAGRSGAP